MAGGSTSLDESSEMRLWDSLAEKKLMGDQEELYSIFVAAEHLEVAYIKDGVTPEAYRAACGNLLAKYAQLVDSLGWAQTDVERFLEAFGIRSLMKAHKRLVIDRVDATALHGTGRGAAAAATENQRALQVHATTSALITALDTIKVLSAIDEVLPVFRAACDKLQAVHGAPQDWDARSKLLVWLRKMSAMRASDVIGEDDRRQIATDLEGAYAEYEKMLGSFT